MKSDQSSDLNNMIVYLYSSGIHGHQVDLLSSEYTTDLPVVTVIWIIP